MADYWAKIYIEILDDPKMATMPDRLWRRTIEIFLMAKKFAKDGHLPETKQLAWMLRMSTDDLELDLKQIALTGIITQETYGWFVVQFAKRQAASSNTERSQQFRQRNQQQQYYDDATQSQRNVAQRQRTEADTEAEAEGGNGDIPLFRQLSTAFVNASHIPELTGGAPRWVEACEKLVKAGVEVGDIETAVKEMRTKNLTIATISSIVNPSIQCMAKRKGHKQVEPIASESY